MNIEAVYISRHAGNIIFIIFFVWPSPLIYDIINTYLTHTTMYGGERRGPRESYSGRLYERDCFGEAVRTEEFERQSQNPMKGPEGRLSNLEAMYEQVKLAQPGDPTDPKKGFARDLRLAVSDALGLVGDDIDGLRFFTAIGTTLDKFEGVDAFFEVVDPTSGKRYRITMDATMNKEKEESGHKADIIIGEVKDPEENEAEYLESVENYGKRIAARLNDMRKEDGVERRFGPGWVRQKAA